MNVTTKYLAAASFVLALTATTGASAAPPAGATLTIPAPFGSSAVLAWSWGASNSGSIGPGSPPGKVNVQDLALTRNTDGQSPLFFSYMAKGTHLPTVVLVDGSTTITLTDAIVTSQSTGDSPGAKPTTPTENITINFARVAYTVNGVTTCFNIVTNTSC